MHRLIKLFAVALFAASSIACGQIELPMTLALQGDENIITITITPDAPSPPSYDIELEGGVETRMVIELSLFDLLYQHGIYAAIMIDDLLFAGTPFQLLGQSTGEVCVILDDMNPGGGAAFIDIFNGILSYDMALGTSVLVGNPLFAEAIPNGFPFAIEISETSEFTLIDMLSLLFGNAEGGPFGGTQTISDVIIAEIDLGGPAPLQIPMGIEATMTLGTANAFPTGELLDDCIAFLEAR